MEECDSLAKSHTGFGAVINKGMPILENGTGVAMQNP
jgi:hypothetical protein